MKFRIQFTGILNDTWIGGQIFTNREDARAMVRHIMTTDRFDSGKRACVKSARVIEWK